MRRAHDIPWADMDKAASSMGAALTTSLSMTEHGVLHAHAKISTVASSHMLCIPAQEQPGKAHATMSMQQSRPQTMQHSIQEKDLNAYPGKHFSAISAVDICHDVHELCDSIRYNAVYNVCTGPVLPCSHAEDQSLLLCI